MKDSELANRKKFVEESKNTIDGIKSSMDSPAVKKKLEEDKRKTKRDTYEQVNTQITDAISRENDDFIADNKQVKKQLIKDQEQNLELLDQAVGRLGKYGEEINSEVKYQNKLIDNLGNEVDQASDKMSAVQAQLSKLLKTKDSCQIWTVVILAVILIILVALVIWV